MRDKKNKLQYPNCKCDKSSLPRAEVLIIYKKKPTVGYRVLSFEWYPWYLDQVNKLSVTWGILFVSMFYYIIPTIVTT